MRKELQDLIEASIIYKYDLPNSKKGITKSILSTDNDKCYDSIDNDALAEIIYNSIVEYSFNEFDLSEKDYNNLHHIALKTKLKYNESADEKYKLNYGFLGETILYCILFTKFGAKAAISRGYFYNPLEFSETKGYDSYHIIEYNNITELWFGEVKFRNSHSSCIDSAVKSIDKALSDSYLSQNFLAIYNHKNNFNIEGTKIEKIIDKWNLNPIVDIIEVIKQYNIKLIYPIVILYDKHRDGYDKSIKDAINHINTKYTSKHFTISIPFSIYFILLPVDKVKDVKTTVISWIESKKQLL